MNQSVTDRSSVLKNKSSAQDERVISKTTSSFVDNRPETLMQRKLQQIANNANLRTPIQRKPKSSSLTDLEESEIETKITQKKYQEALDLLKQTAFLTSSSINRGNVGKYIYDSGNVNYGIAEQDNVDPAKNNTVDIKFGPLAFTDITILVSTAYHEMVHAMQFTKPSLDKDKIGESDYVYGYAKEKSGYIEAAQEIETHWMEIVDAEIMGTSTNKSFMTSRGIALSNYWSKMYSAQNSDKKSSKPGQYRLRSKPLVEEAYSTLKKMGIDISTFDKRGGIVVP
jgi:hypothetical protein